MFRLNMTPQEYQTYVKTVVPSSPLLKNMAVAFVVGGGICTLGQLLGNFYQSLGVNKEAASSLVSLTLVFLSAFFTALGLYHKLARYAGAGTLIPVTGFANAVVSPAIDFHTEGLITGTAAKMFTVAGPVIVFGTVASIVYGLFLWAFI